MKTPNPSSPRLVNEDEEHTENARYILAVMLERKKLLRETDTQEIPSGILRVYEHRKTGDVFLIKDPQIPLSEVETVQEEIRLLLDPNAKTIEEAGGKAEEQAEPAGNWEAENENTPNDPDEEE